MTSEIEGLIKTATEKSIILRIEQEYKNKEEMMRNDRKVLDWSSQGGGEGDGSEKAAGEDNSFSKASLK